MTKVKKDPRLQLLKDFQRAFDSYLHDAVMKETSRDSGPGVIVRRKAKKIIFRASATGSCRRRIWYVLKKGKPPEDPELLQLFYNGHILHEAMSNLMLNMPSICLKALDDTHFRKRVVKKDEWRVYLTGTPDFVADFDGSDVVVDFKGLSRHNMDTFDSSSLVAHYTEQCNSYCFLTDSIGYLIAARSKERGTMKYKIGYHDPKRLRKWARSLIKVVQLKHPPRRDFSMDTFDCKYCPFRQECWMLSFNTSGNTQGLKKKQLRRVTRMLNEWRGLKDSKDEADDKMGEIRRVLLNLHESMKLKTVRIEGVGYTQIRPRTFRRVVIPAEEIEKFERRMLRQGKARVDTGETASLYVIPSKRTVGDDKA